MNPLKNPQPSKPQKKISPYERIQSAPPEAEGKEDETKKDIDLKESINKQPQQNTNNNLSKVKKKKNIYSKNV